MTEKTVSRYETEIDLNHPNNSQTMLITMAGRDRAVLDVGCAAGDTARALAARGCTVSGVEIDEAAAEPGKDLYEDLVIADIDESPLSTHFKAESFDAIIFGDVLEHLRDPAAALRDAMPLLAPDGRILVSIPNVAHAAVRLALLQGSWDYSDKGLLDRTHLTFYTRESACRLLEDAGLVIEELRATVLDPLHHVVVEDITIDTDRLPPGVIEWVRHQPEALVFQYVAAARVLGDGEVRPPRPRLVPARPLDQTRFRDEHTARMTALQDEKHRALTVRDHIIGQEASLATAAAKNSQAVDRAKFAERRARRTRQQLEALTSAVEGIARSRRPRRAAARALEELRRPAPRGGRVVGAATGPLFSIVTPVYNTPIDILRATIASVTAQTCGDWELVLVDDCSPDQAVRDVLHEAAAKRLPDQGRRARDQRSHRARVERRAGRGPGRVHRAPRPRRRARAARPSSGSSRSIDKVPDVDYVYSDEDKIDGTGEHFDRFYKPAWSPERLRGHMYTCHFSVLRASCVREVGGFHEGTEGSQDHDLVLRVTEIARRVVHIPEVLYHWRVDPRARPRATRRPSPTRGTPASARSRPTSTGSASTRTAELGPTRGTYRDPPARSTRRSASASSSPPAVRTR